MVRSRQNGIAPDIGDNLSGKAGTSVVEVGGKKASEGERGNKSRPKKRRSKRNNSEKVEGIQAGVVSDEGEGHSGGKVEAAAVNNREILRNEVMTQVLQDYNAKPIVQAEVPHKQFFWPFYRLRRLLGWAHVALHDAVLDGNIVLVKGTLLRYIRKCPAKINEHDEEGRTALALALMEQREDIADLILSIDDTDVNAPDTSTGLSPLHYAVLLDLGSSAQKLAFRGANINVPDKVVGMTPLMLACRLGHESMVDMLVNVFGAESDPADRAGWTCLHYATYHNEYKIVQFLLMHGADADKKDNRGMTAIDWGEHMNHGETCAIFSSFESLLA
ncbi:unnamed protein product [Pylaiella littoralis]